MQQWASLHLLLFAATFILVSKGDSSFCRAVSRQQSASTLRQLAQLAIGGQLRVRALVKALVVDLCVASEAVAAWNRRCAVCVPPFAGRLLLLLQARPLGVGNHRSMVLFPRTLDAVRWRWVDTVAEPEIVFWCYASVALLVWIAQPPQSDGQIVCFCLMHTCLSLFFFNTNYKLHPLLSLISNGTENNPAGGT